MCYYGITKSAGENDMLSNCYLAKVSDNKDPEGKVILNQREKKLNGIVI